MDIVGRPVSGDETGVGRVTGDGKMEERSRDRRRQEQKIGRKIMTNERERERKKKEEETDRQTDSRRGGFLHNKGCVWSISQLLG